MKFNKEFTPSLAGFLLVAHPGLADVNFRKSVILLSTHSRDKGSLGVVINHPLGKTVAEYDKRFEQSELADVPLYHGGPIAKDRIILAAWQWLEHESIFKLHFGIPEDRAIQLMKDPSVQVRAFLGYSGWTHGQLEKELEKRTWLLSSVKNLTNKAKDSNIWKRIVLLIRPELKIFVEVPEDLSSN